MWNGEEWVWAESEQEQGIGIPFRDGFEPGFDNDDDEGSGIDRHVASELSDNAYEDFMAYHVLTSDCCDTVKVFHDDNYPNASQVDGGNRIFTTFKIEPHTYNGRVHYTSRDGLSAISYCEHGGGQWILMVTSDYTSSDAGYGL